MTRVKIQLPDDFIFRTDIPVRISDINYGGHLGNDAILSIIHDSRVHFLKSLGLDELDIGGTSVIMADTAIVYRSEGFHGDNIQIDIAVNDFTNSGFSIYYRMINLTTGVDLAHAKTGMVCFNYDRRKVEAVPPSFVELVNSQKAITPS
ncbi:MAG: thioesterase family protein [Bacteroidetes bacterium]|nr:thioesterase family protein [Bacteroidota bacterium]